jgi:hypothetical protein
MSLKTRPRKNSTVAITMGRDGQPIKHGDGEAYAVVTGDVVDRYGGGLGQAHDFIEKSVKVCEAALTHFKVVDP